MVAKTIDLAGLRVFISYARGGLDHTWAEKIQRHLEEQGADVWRDEHSIEEGNEDWHRSIERGIEKADAVVCIVGRDTNDSRWQQREIAFADKRNKAVVVLRTDDVELPFGLLDEKKPIEARADMRETLDVLARKLAEISQKLNRIPDNDEQSFVGVQRREELAYLNDLIHKDYSDREKRYVALEANERRSNALERVMNTVMDTDAVLKDFGMDRVDHEQTVEKTYTDALDAYRSLRHKPVRRLAVLGEPGAGKSFSLQRIVVEYAQQALKDPKAPIPLLVPLGFWTRESLSLEDFIERQLDKLGRYMITLRDQQRAVLLLDGMNEIPVRQRQSKVAQIRALAQDERFASAW
ncbi:MAG: TIR domain-containing protein [Nitrosomonas sp.]|nr:TIR domain-containing protein [Nitrosomonas sp.]